jgi:thiol:disulfide interchange protein DsbA
MLQHLPRSLRVLLAGALLIAGSVVHAQGYTEGVHFKALTPPQPTNVAKGKVEVVEVFWYGCPHCYAIEPKFESWQANVMPKNVQVVLIPATWNELVRLHAKVYYAAELLKKLPELHAEIFREINVRGNHLETPEKIEQFFTAHGVAKQDFEKVWNSFGLESKVRRADDLARSYKITGTPTFIVNGRWVTDVKDAGGEDPLFKVLTWLAAREKPAN